MARTDERDLGDRDTDDDPNHFQEGLQKMGACPELIEWAGKFEDVFSAFGAFPRGDWLLWLGLKLGIDHQVMVKAACACAKLAFPFTKNEWPIRLVKAAERWASGDPSASPEKLASLVNKCRAAALEAGCHAEFQEANAIYAAVYAAKIVLQPDDAVVHGPKAALYAVEAAVEAATNRAHQAKIRRDMAWDCAMDVRKVFREDKRSGDLGRTYKLKITLGPEGITNMEESWVRGGA